MIMKSVEYLKSKNIKFRIIHLSEVPRTAKDVERIYGCSLHQVLKTLVFSGEKPVLATLPGDERVDINKLEKVSRQEGLQIAKPKEVEEITGFSVGGITPFAVGEDVIIVIEKSIFETDTVNIGSGVAEIGIELKSNELRRAWDGIVADIIE